MKKRTSGVAIIQLPENATPSNVDDALSRLPGISDYKLNSVHHTVRVEFDPEKLTTDQIREKLGAK